MTQYPNEKDPHSNWIYPQGTYTSRDGAPPPPSGHAPPPSGYAPPPSGYAPPSQYQAPPPPQGYYPSQGEQPSSSQYQAGPPPQGYYPPPQGAPPSYGYAQTHLPAGPAYDQKGTSGPAHENYLVPPGAPPTSPHAAPAAGSSSSSHDTNEESGLSLGAFFGNKGNPPMWNRQAPQNLPYNPFPPMCLISNSKELSKGFPELPPPCQLNPHPFATHDVTQEDWKRFLADVKKAGSLSPQQRIRSNVIPLVTGMSFFTGFLTTMAIERKMKYKNRQAAGDLVDHWNHYFFGPRRMEVVLCQASQRLSGREGAAPIGDANQQRMANGLRQRTDDDDDDDSSEEDGHGGHGQYQNQHQNPGFGDRRARRSARREERRARKAERREWKARGDNKEPYQLFVTTV